MNPVRQLGAPAVYTAFERPDPQLVGKLGKLGVATVHEALQRTGYMRNIHSRVSGMRICGPAVTSLDHAGDNLMAHAAIATCQPGDVLVLTTKAPSQHGMFGDLMAELCRARGIAGVIINAGVRDIAILQNMPFPAWSKVISAEGCGKSNPGWANVPVICGEQLVRPGDVILADDDGVVVIPLEDLAKTVAAAESREAREAQVRARFAKGELSLQVSGFAKLLSDMGVSYPDEIKQEPDQ